MGGFFLARGADPAALARAKRVFERAGVRHFRDLIAGEYKGFVCSALSGDAPALYACAEGTAALAGCLFYRDRFGAAALPLLFADFKDGDEPPSRAGHHAVIVARADSAWLFADRLGFYQVFHDAGLRVISSSLQATAEALGRVRLSRQGLYEYVHHGTTLGEDTLLEEVKMLSPGAAISLGPSPSIRLSSPLRSPGVEPASLDWHAERCLAATRKLVSTAVSAFGDNIQAPLSGGYDSRLLISLLRQAGARPHVYVYGSKEHPDVRVAKAVAKALGFPLEHFNKEAVRKISPDEFAEIVELNFYQHDVPGYGGIFDTGLNRAAHESRSRGGALSMSGGGGEVFRNFFYLRDASFTVRELLWTFYSQFDPGTCTDEFDEEAFYRGMEAKVRKTLGLEGDRMSRAEVELLYPTFRCRAAFGRETSRLNCFGPWFYPFMEPAVLPAAGAVPIALKNHGRLEARMIELTDPKMAAQASDYGHNFLGAPPLKRRAKDWLTYLRPPFLRRYSYRLQKRRGGPVDLRTGVMRDEFLGRLIDPACPIMSRFFQIDKVRDPEAFRRICSAELFVSRLGVLT